MKKKNFGSIAVLAITTVSTWNVNLDSQKSDLSDVSLANVEALAEGESPDWLESSTTRMCYFYLTINARSDEVLFHTPRF